MKVKLIKTEEGYYLIDDTEIKVDSYYLAWETNYNTPKWVRYVLCSGLNGIKQYNIFASTLDLEEVPKLSLKNCKEVELGYDLDKLFQREIDELMFTGNLEDDSDYRSGMYRGAKILLEILADKKFSEEDVKKAILFGEDNTDTESFDNLSNEEVNKFIQSLQQTEWDVEIVMGDPIGISDKYTPDTKPKLDENGCLILKRK